MTLSFASTTSEPGVSPLDQTCSISAQLLTPKPSIAPGGTQVKTFTKPVSNLATTATIDTQTSIDSLSPAEPPNPPGLCSRRHRTIHLVARVAFLHSPPSHATPSEVSSKISAATIPLPHLVQRHSSFDLPYPAQGTNKQTITATIRGCYTLERSNRPNGTSRGGPSAEKLRNHKGESDICVFGGRSSVPRLEKMKFNYVPRHLCAANLMV
ncbi:hypothetical protein K461DRAFT_37486 [Myriangium duriaei CBS 260.36]|uniref:Uncharacterized protein n=1 Tax=Myriangium duriaei CBS 260.36 TaxID=1168546 RepID=A0A9P4J030_9PEZI|nr:hypothetical protein K461DRAFT_37486 [Myriangium duriaei CBS 260.36]